MSSAHRKSVFENMVKSFNQRGFLETTLPKAKRLKSILQKEQPELKLHLVRTYNRKGDNAQMARVISGSYLDKKFKPKKAKTNAKAD